MAKKIVNVVYKVDDRELTELKGELKANETQAKKLEKELHGVGASAQKAGATASNSFLSFKNILNTISVAAITAALTSLARKVFDLGVAQEQTNIAFETFLGDAERARKVIADLTKFSIVTPFTPDQVFKSAKTLLAFNVEAEKLIPTLKFLGDVSAGTGKDISEMAVIFGQIRSTGRLMGQDLLQLINAGFNPLQIISQKTGKSVGDLKKEMEKGLVTFDMVEQAFIDATSEGGLFFDLMSKQSASVGGLLSTIQGNLEEIGKALFATNSGPVKDLALGLSDLTSNVDFFADAINRAIKANGLYWIVRGLQLMKEDLQGSEEAQRAWGLALLDQQKQLLNTNQTLEERRKTMGNIVYLEQQLGIFKPGTTEDPLPWVTEEKAEAVEEATKKIEGLKQAMSFLAKEIEDVNINVKDGLFDDNAFLTGTEEAFKEAEKTILDQLNQQYNAEYDALVEKNEKELAEIEAQNERKKQLQQEITNFAIDSIQQVLVASLGAGMADISAIQERYAEQERLAGDNKQKIDALRLQERFELEKAEKLNKDLEKRAALRKIAIDTAAGIARAVAASPTTFGLPFSAFVAATGLIQAATVRKFKKGEINIDGPGTTTSDSINARLSRGESVINADATSRSKNLLEAINNRKIDDGVLYQLAANGGSAQVFDDSRIVSAINKNKVDYARHGYHLMEVQRVNDNLKRIIRSKTIN